MTRLSRGSYSADECVACGFHRTRCSKSKRKIMYLILPRMTVRACVRASSLTYVESKVYCPKHGTGFDGRLIAYRWSNGG